MRADPYDWRMARRIAFLAANEPGRGIHRNDLARRLGNLGEELGRWIMLAYSRGMVDCVRDWVVAPPVQSPAPRLDWGQAGEVLSSLAAQVFPISAQLPPVAPRSGGSAMSRIRVPRSWCGARVPRPVPWPVLWPAAAGS